MYTKNLKSNNNLFSPFQNQKNPTNFFYNQNTQKKATPQKIKAAA